MARKPEVTRHVTHTSCVCKCLNKKTGQIYGKILEAPRINTNVYRLLQKIRYLYETDEVRVIEIESFKVVESFVRYPELEFLLRAPQIVSQTVLFDSTKDVQEREN